MLHVIARTTTSLRKLAGWAVILILLAPGLGCKERRLFRPTPQMKIAQRFRIRVLLLNDVKLCTISVPGSFAVATGQTERIEAYFEKPGQSIKITLADGAMIIANRHFKSRQITILPDEPFVFQLNGQYYRGDLQLLLNESGSAFQAVNVVPLEAYLAGVVGSEMPYYWEPEALKAQAIIARTYCLYMKKHFGGERSWDVRSTQASQVYAGIKAECRPVWDAVNSTSGQVLLCAQDDGKQELFPTYYSSTCGGHTENSKNVFGKEFAPLVGVVCPYCRDITRTSILFWPTAQFDNGYVTKRIAQKYPKLRKLGQIKAIQPTKESKYENFSRITSVKITGTNGKSGYLRAEDLRLTLDPSGNKFRSTACKILEKKGKFSFTAGRGWGHGVGLCQSGAQGMARQGKTAYQILGYYYPNSHISKVY
jgi:stage II sporulation protein D